MRFEDIHVGDVVRIRDWDDMVQEFGIIEGCIKTKPVFSKRMRHLCGRVMTITEAIGSRDIITDDIATEPWFLGADMFEPAQLTLEPFDNDDIRMLLEI